MAKSKDDGGADKRPKREFSDITPGFLRMMIISALRKLFSMSTFTKYRGNMLMNSKKITKYITSSKGKQLKRVFFPCNECSKEFPRKEVRIDHIVPVVGDEGFTTWDDYINRLFCGIDNLQILCLDCHKAKTSEERSRRAKIRWEKKRQLKEQQQCQETTQDS